MEIRTLKNENKVTNAANVKGKVIRKAQIARQLVQRGQRIIDIKADRNDPDGKRSVYVFEDNDEFQNVFSSIIEENKRNRENSDIATLKRQAEEMRKQIDALTKNVDEKE